MHCRGKIRVWSASSQEISDDLMFCGVPPLQPLSDATLRVNDDRFHVPILSRVTDWVPHHTRATNLQPGTYLLGAKYFAGLHDACRLPVGRHFLRVTIECANGHGPFQWEHTEPVVVEQHPPTEDDIILSAGPVVSSGTEWLNIEARASRKYTSIEGVRLFLKLGETSYPINWSTDSGGFNGDASTTLFANASTKALLAVRCECTFQVLGAVVNAQRHCYVTDVGFRVHKRPSITLPAGETPAVLTLVWGTGTRDWPIRIKVPEFGAGTLAFETGASPAAFFSPPVPTASDNAAAPSEVRASPEQLARDVELEWKVSGDQLGLVARNTTAQRLTFGVSVVDILRWSDSHGVFAKRASFTRAATEGSRQSTSGHLKERCGTRLCGYRFSQRRPGQFGPAERPGHAGPIDEP